jgi:cobalt-zinc-cadmium efflux system membrane fusion protein
MVWIALLLPVAAGCGGGEKKEEAHEAPEVAGDEHHEGEEAGEGTLAVDPETLRDLKLTTFAAELRPGGEGVTALGELKVNEDAYAEVGSPIDARVVRPLASPGQPVRRGQPLAELQSVEVGQARARRTAAQARAELARKTVERKRGLAAERIVSQGELQRAEAEAAEAEAELRATESNLVALGVGGGGGSAFTLVSPISGTVLERTAVRGRSVGPSEPLFRIGDLSRLWLVVQAPERDAVRLRPGASAEITLAALPGQTLRGTVEWVGREVDAHSRTVPVRIVLPNGDGRLRPGMFATAWVETGIGGDRGEPVVAVPATALQRMEDQWVVFLPRGEGRFEVRPVERGRDLGDEVAILSGLKPGETVVDEGSFVLRAEAGKKEGGGEHHH